MKVNYKNFIYKAFEYNKNEFRWGKWFGNRLVLC